MTQRRRRRTSNLAFGVLIGNWDLVEMQALWR